MVAIFGLRRGGYRGYVSNFGLCFRKTCGLWMLGGVYLQANLWMFEWWEGLFTIGWLFGSSSWD